MSDPSGFRRDKEHWLFKLSPDEWIAAALGELGRAEKAWDAGDARAGVVGMKRAAGMGLNAALIVEPDESWGRTYVEHVQALARDARVPEAVREAARVVIDAKAPGGDVVNLRTPRGHRPVVEAARDVVAHAWAVAKRHESLPDAGEGSRDGGADGAGDRSDAKDD
jgi:HEPN domain-containing protein